jgi:uncharacterized protein with ParB-like and HNH nuclease domain
MAVEERDGIEIEIEEVDAENNQTEKPWDAKLIRVDQKVYSIRQIMDMIDDDSLDLNPDFQRLQVWEPYQKSRLIESIFLRIPIPTFYFSSDMESNMQVVDGVQRLSAIYEFYKDRHRLGHMEYLFDLRGKRYSDLREEMWGRRFDGTQLQINVIDPQTPSEVKFDIFKRINTGGTPLNAQEIRHCLSTGRSRKFLAALAASEEFNYATNDVVKNHKRMTDRELALRFCALRLWKEGRISYEDYHGSMDKFLDAVNEKLGTAKQIDDGEQKHLADLFVNAMRDSIAVFDRHSFRKTEGAQLNKALFDSISVNIAEYGKSAVEAHATEIREKIYGAIEKDLELIDAISQSTNSVRKVKYRFKFMETLLSEILL